MNLFEKLDIFGIPIGLNYKNDGAYKTSFGGIITILFIVLMASLFFNSVDYSSSPTVETEPGIIEFNTNEFMIATKIDQDNFIKSPYFNVTFEQRHYQRFQNGTYQQTKTPVYLEPCTWEHFKGLPNLQYDWESAFDLQNLDDFLCLQKNQTFKVGGKYENEHFYHLKYTVNQCKNSTDTKRLWRPVCKTPDEILAKNLDEDTRLNFLFTNYNLNPEKPSDIAQIFLESMFFTFQPNKMYSTANIFFNEQVITTDNSLLPFSDNQDMVFPQYKNGDFKQQYSVGSFSKYCEIFFLRSSYNTQTDRKFQKIDEVISYIGGFSQIFLIVFALLGNESIFIKKMINIFFKKNKVRIYNTYQYQLELANKLYDFDFGEKEDKDSNQNTNQNKQKNSSTCANALTKQNNRNTPFDQSSIYQSKYQQENFQQKTERNDQDRKQIIQEANKRYSMHIVGQNQAEGNHQFEQAIQRSEMQQIRQYQGQSQQEEYILGLKGTQSPQTTQLSPIKIIELEKMQYSSEQSPIFLPISQIDKQNQLSIIKQIQEQRRDSAKQQTPSNRDFNQQAQQDVSKRNSQDILSFNPLQSDQKNKPIKSEGGVEIDKTIIRNKAFTYQNGASSEYHRNELNTIQYNHNIKKGIKYYNAQQFLEREVTQLVKKENPIKMTFQYFINAFSFGKLCNTPAVILLNKANENLSKDIDLYELIKKIKELEKLKKLLLNKEQETLFSFFPKPVITLEEEEIIPQRDILKRMPTNSKTIFNRLLHNQKISSFKSVALIIKAITRFKMNMRKNQFSQIRQLYDSYLKILDSQNVETKEQINSFYRFFQIQPLNQKKRINKRLIELLGKEVVKIFEATKRIYIKTDEQIQRENQLLFQQNDIKLAADETHISNLQYQNKSIIDIENQNNLSSIYAKNDNQEDEEYQQQQQKQQQQQQLQQQQQQQEQQQQQQEQQEQYEQMEIIKLNNLNVPLQNEQTQQQLLQCSLQNITDQNISILNGTDMTFIKNDRAIENVQDQGGEEEEEEIEEYNLYKSYNINKQDINNLTTTHKISIISNQNTEVSPMQVIQKVKKNNFLSPQKQKKRK